ARTLLSPEAAIELIPRDLHDRRSAVHVVRWQGGAGETHVERLHLSGRQDVTGLDRRLAGDRRGESLVPRCRARHAIARERIERIAQAPQRIEPRMRHRHGRHYDRVASEWLDLEAQLRERVTVRLEGVAL